MERGERIEGGLWDEQPVGRDYFVACNPLGACYWVFREVEGPAGSPGAFPSAFGSLSSYYAGAAMEHIFFTVHLAEWKRTLLVDHVDLLCPVFQKVKADRFRIDAMVIFDLLHAVWTLPVGDCDFATRWM